MKKQTIFSVKTYYNGEYPHVVGLMAEMNPELLKAYIDLSDDEYAHFEMLCDGFNEKRLGLDDIHLIVENDDGEEIMYHFSEYSLASL